MEKERDLATMRMNNHVEDFGMRLGDLNNAVMIRIGVCKIVDFLFKNLERKIEEGKDHPKALEGYSLAAEDVVRFLEDVNECHVEDLLDTMVWQRCEIWDLEDARHESE